MISVLFLFAITTAGVVPCGGRIKSPRISSIVQIIFSFCSFEISEDILRNQNIIIGLESFSNLRFYIYSSVWIILVFETDKSCKITIFLFGSILPNLKGHYELNVL